MTEASLGARNSIARHHDSHNHNNDLDNMLTSRAVARRLGISIRTLDRRRPDGQPVLAD
jgi:hypothetical protein